MRRTAFLTAVASAALVLLAVAGVVAQPAQIPPTTVRVLAEQVTPPPATPEPAPAVAAPPPVAVAQAPVVRAPSAPRPAHAPRVRTAVAGPKATGGTVRIPSVGITGPLVSVGLDQNGAMVLAKNARDVAWLDNGSFPGPTRNAILAGHRNWSGRPGTFLRLEDVKQGDQVIVDLYGKTYLFTISWVRVYDPNDAPVQELMGPTDVDSLTLVTCGGDFNHRTHHYEKRVVVRAEASPA